MKKAEQNDRCIFNQRFLEDLSHNIGVPVVELAIPLLPPGLHVSTQNGTNIDVENEVVSTLYHVKLLRHRCKELKELLEQQNDIVGTQHILINNLVSQFQWNQTIPWTRGIGLENLGRTCYINAMLQALFHNSSIAA